MNFFLVIDFKNSKRWDKNMEFPSCPEDNTSVIKIVNELQSYLNRPPQQTPRQRLDLTFGLNSLSSSLGFFKGDSPNQIESNLSFRKRPTSSLSNDEKLEQVVTKAKLSKLESDLVSLKCKSAEKEIELEKQHRLSLLKNLKDQSQYEDVQRKSVLYAKILMHRVYIYFCLIVVFEFYLISVIVS